MRGATRIVSNELMSLQHRYHRRDGPVLLTMHAARIHAFTHASWASRRYASLHTAHDHRMLSRPLSHENFVTAAGVDFIHWLDVSIIFLADN
jgi:hypothetical protein